MLIGPPKKQIVELKTKVGTSNEKIESFINSKGWKCPTCGSMVHDWTLVCPFNQNGNYCNTPKPI